MRLAMQVMRTTFGLCMCLASACAFESHLNNNPDVDGAPIARDDSITTMANVPIMANLLVNDRDPDNDTVAVAGFTQAAHGTVSVTAGVATYTPAASYIGSDS